MLLISPRFEIVGRWKVPEFKPSTSEPGCPSLNPKMVQEAATTLKFTGDKDGLWEDTLPENQVWLLLGSFARDYRDAIHIQKYVHTYIYIYRYLYIYTYIYICV